MRWKSVLLSMFVCNPYSLYSCYTVDCNVDDDVDDDTHLCLLFNDTMQFDAI